VKGNAVDVFRQNDSGKVKKVFTRSGLDKAAARMHLESRRFDENW
jgi:hypothetical protein